VDEDVLKTRYKDYANCCQAMVKLRNLKRSQSTNHARLAHRLETRVNSEGKKLYPLLVYCQSSDPVERLASRTAIQCNIALSNLRSDAYKGVRK
jgi:hypothetical protein